jgi:adenylate cyclase
MSEPGGARRAMTRRAVLFADLVESVRLYAHFETQTIERWRRFAATVRERVAPAHAGRLVRTVGDGLLLDFDDAAAATRAAFALHQEVAGLNPPGATDDALALRIGLHLADVVRDDTDLWGAGVNLAARVASLAQPGQTVATAELRMALDDQVHADIRDLGLRYVKHLDEPVRAFVLLPPGRPALQTPLSGEDLRPAIAVVPFMTLPVDPGHDALGHALADDIIASLSRHPGLRVLSRVSTATLRGLDLPLERVRALLGASFLLSGRLYMRGSRVRLNAELAELREGQVLWAGAVHGDVDALFEGEDEIVPQIVGQVSQHVLAHELVRVKALPMDSLPSYSLLLGASGLLNSLVPREFDRSQAALQHLVERHPRQGVPHALLTQWYVFRLLQGWTANAGTDAIEARRHADLALERSPEHSAAWVADGTAKVFEQRDFAGAATSYRRALEIDPHCATAWARLSECQSEAGEHGLSLQTVRRAIELSPLDPQRYIYECYAARTCYVMGDYEQAANFARASVRRNTLHAVPHRLLVVSLWLCGQQESARAAASDFIRVMPKARATDGLSASSRSHTVTPFMRWLHEAGVPL